MVFVYSTKIKTLDLKSSICTGRINITIRLFAQQCSMKWHFDIGEFCNVLAVFIVWPVLRENSLNQNSALPH